MQMEQELPREEMDEADRVTAVRTLPGESSRYDHTLSNENQQE